MKNCHQDMGIDVSACAHKHRDVTLLHHIENETKSGILNEQNFRDVTCAALLESHKGSRGLLAVNRH
jgi:hypothetical protein